MGNKRTRRYNKRTRRTRKYGGTLTPSIDSIDSNIISARIPSSDSHSVSSNHDYIGEPDEPDELDNVDVSAIEHDEEDKHDIYSDLPYSKKLGDKCDKCYDRIRHILYKTTLPKNNKTRDALYRKIIRQLKAQIPPHPMD
jgi:hypothetical protein